MDACRYVNRYQGIHPPRCNGGEGCKACWEKYNSITGHRNRLAYWKRINSLKNLPPINHDERC